MWSCSRAIPQSESIHVGMAPIKTLCMDSSIQIEAKDLISNISFVRLESSWKNIIGQIEQILFTDDRIIVFDRYKAKAIYVFDRNGKFLNKIGMLGHGPQEYVEPSYIALVPGKNQIAVFDLAPKKVKIYDLNGKFIRSEDVPIYLFSGEYLTDQVKVGATIGRRYLSLPEWGKASLFMFNKNWEVISAAFQDPFPEGLTYTSTKNLKKFKDRIYYTPAFENRIYRVYLDSVQLLYQLDFGDRTLPDPGKYQINDDRSFGNLLKKHHTFDGYFVDLAGGMFIQTADNTRGKTFFFDKIKDSVFCLSNQISNPLENWFHTSDYYVNDSTIASSTDAASIVTLMPWMRQFAKAIPQKEQTEQIIEQLAPVTENDNPVLFFFTLKSDR